MKDKQSKTTRRGLILGAVGGVAGAALAGSADSAPEKGETKEFDVRLSGAAGDGKADDAAAFQAALDAAAKAGGGSITIPSGDYRIGRPLYVRSSDRIDVVGMGNTSRLLHEADEPLIVCDDDIALRESTFRNFGIYSVGKPKSADTAAILCRGGTERSTFSHVFFKTETAPIGSGIVVEKVMDTTTIDHCLMWGPIIGWGIKAARGSEVRVFGARLIGSANPYNGIDNKSGGILLTGNNGGVHIVTTDIIGMNTGLQIGQPGGPSNREVFITHATFDSSIHGIVQIDNAYTSIAGCWSASSDEDQILVEESAAGAILSISGGTIFNGGAYGRKTRANGLVVKAGSFMLTGVTVRHNKGTGILVGKAVRDYTITGCRVTHNGTGAILDGDNYSFTGNVFAGNLETFQDNGGPNKSVLANVGI